MGFPPNLSPMIIVFYLLCPYIAASHAASCDVSTFGKPEKSDCLTLFEKFTTPEDDQARFFDEEQLRVDSKNTWPGVTNVFEQPIVQLPKYYAMSTSIPRTVTICGFRIIMMTLNCIDTCNFALMPYTNPATRMSYPLDISSWGSIKQYGNWLMHDCLDQYSAGGEIFVKSSMYAPACRCIPEIAVL